MSEQLRRSRTHTAVLLTAHDAGNTVNETDPVLAVLRWLGS